MQICSSDTETPTFDFTFLSQEDNVAGGSGMLTFYNL